MVDAYDADKDILDAYGDTVTIKRRRDNADDDEEPSAGSNRGSKRRRAGKEPESTSAPKAKTSKTAGKSTDGSKSQHKLAGGATKEQTDEETSQHLDWFQKPAKLPTSDRDWNKTLPAVHRPVQPWLSHLAREEGSRKSFDELMDTPLEFSAFMMNRLKIDTLTPELLAGPTFELMKGLQYPHDLRKPLPLIPNSRGRQVIPFDHFINNDLAYLSGGVSSRTYATFVTKTKAADYGHIKWIEDLVPNTIWSKVPVNYNKHALWGISHWGRKLTKLQIVEWHGYKHLDWITICRDDNKQYTFKEGDFKWLRLQDIKDMLVLLVQGKLTNLNVEDHLAFGVSLRMMEYLPKKIWRQSDRERAKAKIQAIEKMLKSRRIMRSLERFVGGRPYEGDFRLLQRTI
ncbi:hypothetical protein Tco_0480662 [Tanacetum coccineum]